VRLQCEFCEQSLVGQLIGSARSTVSPLSVSCRVDLPENSSTDAQFKLAHDRIAHTLDELEILYLRPFRTQARKRARERRDDPDRREWLQAAVTVDDARPGEKEAHGARAGVLVFDGEQPSLLQLEPEVAKERARHARKRRQAAAAAALDWASPPPPTKAKRPGTRRLVRPDSLPQVPTRPDLSATTDMDTRARPPPAAAPTFSSSSPKPLERDTQNRLARRSPARTARVYTVPSAWEEKGINGPTTSSREPVLALTTSEEALFSPVELQGAALADPSPQGFHPTSPPSNRRLSRRRTSAAISPFSSRSTLESTGETLAPASSINSLQQTSSSETSPRLAHAIMPPPPPALSLLSSMRKTLLTSSGNSSGTDQAGALDEEEDAFPALTRIHQRPDSESSERGSLTTTGSQAAAVVEVPQMLTSLSTSSVLPRAATGTDHLPFLGAQPSFSALPPVPPLPFDLAPSYNSTLGLHASFSQLRSSYPSDAETSSWTRTSGSTAGQGKSAMAGEEYAATTTRTGFSQSTAKSGNNRTLRFSAADAPSSSPGWAVPFTRPPPPQGNETGQLSRSSTIEAMAITSLRLEQDVLRRFSAAVDEDGDEDGDGMGASMYPPLSQETVLESGQSQETGDASVDEEEEEEEEGGDARGQADADSAAEETQESQPS
jgi:hypothetical protein